MKLHCPHCGVKGSAEDSYAGRKVRCPKCQGIFEVQAEMARESEAVAPAAAAYAATPAEAETVTTEGEVLAAEMEAEENLEEEMTPEAPDEPVLEQEQPEPEPALAEVEVEDEAADETEATAEVEPELAPSETGEEESLDWDDIASEIDLELSEEEEEPAEEKLEESPAALSTLVEEDVEEVDGLEPAAGMDEPEPGADENLVADDELEEGEAEPLEMTDDEPLEEVELPSLEGEPETTPAAESLEEVEVAGPVDLDPADEAPLVEPAEEQTAEEELEVEIAEGAVAAAFAGDDLSEVKSQLAGDEVEPEPELEPELEPYGIDKEQCWQCGKDAGAEEPLTDHDGRLFCRDCVPVEAVDELAAPSADQIEDEAPLDQPANERARQQAAAEEETAPFTIGSAISKAWACTKGAKGTVWAASAIMYLVLLAVVAGGAFLLPSAESEPGNMNGLVANGLLQVFYSVLSVLFTAGLLLIGIRKVAGEEISWKMIFKGFSCAGSIIVSTILQFILVSIGLLLLVLPGIYLAVGYTMAVPLIIDKGLSPWQAMETSRKAIHKVWWRVAGLYLVMALLYLVSLIPLGLGIIWTWPMFIVLGGVVYCTLFRGAEAQE